jgi:iron complex outermembrane recepter protein
MTMRHKALQTLHLHFLASSSLIVAMAINAPAAAQAPLTTSPSAVEDTQSQSGPVSPPSQSQVDETATPAEPGLADIVVTAQRRKENLQDVPIAITALDATAVTEQGITDLTGLATRVPSLTFSPFSPGQNIVALRGVSSNDDGAGTDNSIAVFVDGVYSGRVSNINPEMFDVASIEVLRGPQGTLYGKNTIGGAIVINSSLPNLRDVDARVRLEYGNYDRRSIAGLLTGPLSEEWAAKFSFLIRKRDGWIHNRVLGTREQDDDTQAYRGQILYSGDNVRLLLSGDYNRLDVGDVGRIPLTEVVGSLGPIVTEYNSICGPFGGPPKCSANPISGYSNRKSGGVSAKLDIDTGYGEVTSITAWRKSKINWLMDSVGVPSFPLGDLIDDRTEQFSQEVRIAGDSGPVKYVAGLFYLNEKTDRTEVFDFLVQGDIANSSRYTQNNELNSYAAFGQIDWEVTPDLILTGGARYTYERKSIVNNSVAGDIPIIQTTFANSRKANWSQFTPKAVIAYQPNTNTTIYASFAKGFKSGGFGAAPTRVEDTEPLKQEGATSYEAGLKTELFDRTLRLNAAVFYTKYKDLQYQAFGPRPGIPEFGIFSTVNLACAEAAGAEIEVDWLPFQNLMLSGSYGYLSSEYEDALIPNAAFPNQNGQDMIRAPRHKFSLSGRYEIPFADASKVVLNTSYRFTDDQRGELEPYAIQPSYSVFDSRIAWTSKNGNIEIAAWAKNLTDKTYVAHIYTVGGEVIGTFGEPRMYGLSVTLRN